MRNLLKAAMAATLPMLGGCDLSSTVNAPTAPTPTPPPVAVAQPRLFLMGQDYNAKKAVLEKVSSDSVLSADLKDWIVSDAILAAQGDSLYVLNRKANSLTGFAHGDTSQHFVNVQLTGQDDDAFSGANPYAVARIGGRLWVACYGSPYLKAVDLGMQKLIDSIDLSAWAYGKKGSPKAVDVHVWNGKLAVTLQRLNDWDPGDTSVVLILDPVSKLVERSIPLPWKNPNNVFWSGDTMLVACTGKWYTKDYSDIVLDGGLALVNVATGSVKRIVAEETLGANVAKALLLPGGKALISLGHADYSTTLVSINLMDGAVGAVIPGLKNVTDMAWDGTNAWIAEHDAAAPAVYRLDSSGAIKGKVTTTLAPGSLVILP